MKLVRKTITALAVFAPAKLFACAACFGPNIDAPMADGMNWAILTLGVVITTVLGAFGTFLFYAIRRSEAVEAARQQAMKAAAAAWNPPGSPLLKTETQN